jgi:TonB family protein
VRLLSDFETSRSKLLQIILAGQPALGEKLADPSLAQLRQRIAMQCRLTPLSPQEVDEYIACRLRVAGYTGNAIFTPEARGRIADLSEGIPRVISNVCFSAMSLACATGQRQVTAEVIEEVSSDLGLQAGAEPILSDNQSELRYAHNKPPQVGATEDENIPRLAPPSAPRTWGTQGHHSAAPAPPSSITAESTRSSKSQGRRGLYPSELVERTIITMACGAAILAFALAWLAHRTQGSGSVSPPWNSGSSTSPASAQKSATSQVGAERRGANPGHRGGADTLPPIHAGAQTPAQAQARVPPLSEQKLRSPRPSASKAAAPTNNPVHNESTVRGTLEEVVQPVYPEEAREAEVEGTVTLQAIVDATGNVKHVRVLDGKPLLAEAALHAVRRWRYRPYVENGSPAMFRTIIRIRFVLDDVSP